MPWPFVRGVVHRDLKPENVMLGDFGEVLLMDWGLALVLHAPSAATAAMAGTPAYMPPEMAMGPISRVGIASDIYLIGAILYEIITGHAPHTGPTVTACLIAAVRNEILPSPQTGELVEIALKAMSTRPEDRYASMVDFQEAIRHYRSHSESISLSTRRRRLADRGWPEYLRVFRGPCSGFKRPMNSGTATPEPRKAFWRRPWPTPRAMQKGDLDLGSSLLDEKIPEHEPLLKEIRVAQRDRDTRQQRLKTARRIGTALLITVVVVVTVAFFIVQSEKNKTQAAYLQAKESEARAVDAKADAVAKKEEADKAKAIAVTEKEEADRQREAADHAKAEALAKKKEAEEAKTAEEYGAYVARIGLAAAKVEENAFDRARDILHDCPPSLRNWEWGRLNYLCDRAVRDIRTGQRVEAVSFSPDGRRFATSGWGGLVNVWNAQAGQDARNNSRYREPACGWSARRRVQCRDEAALDPFQQRKLCFRPGFFSGQQVPCGRQQRSPRLHQDLGQHERSAVENSCRPFRRRAQPCLLPGWPAAALQFLRSHRHPLGP